jgi:hypothetical protein
LEPNCLGLFPALPFIDHVTVRTLTSLSLSLYHLLDEDNIGFVARAVKTMLGTSMNFYLFLLRLFYISALFSHELWSLEV